MSGQESVQGDELGYASSLEQWIDRYLYIEVLQNTLPFIADVYPDGHRLIANNDPKHTSVAAQQFLTENHINWWCIPPESPDVNPIENLWHELKEYVCREVKPKCQEELVNSIKQFWETVTIHKCRKYINHFRKVIPKVIKVDGAATGY